MSNLNPRSLNNSDPIDNLTLKRFSERIQRENNERRKNGIPIARFDAKKGIAYMEYYDGRKVYADKT